MALLLSLLTVVEHVIFTLVVAMLVSAWSRGGIQSVIELLMSVLNYLPGYRVVVRMVIGGQVKSYAKKLRGSESANGQSSSMVRLPEQGVPHADLLEELKKQSNADKTDVTEGRLFAYVYTDNDGHFDLQKKAYAMFEEKTGLSPDHDQLLRIYREAFMHENALNPALFPSLRRFEIETISMAASMLNGDSNVVGSLTSGGTESLLMAIKTYRDRARALRPHIKHPEMVAPITIHPGHEKAAHYFGIKIVHVPVGADYRPDMVKYEKAITANTIALLASAPQYCHGIVDPIPEIAELAVRRDLPLHVDACFGGFMLPWVEKLGYSVPTFDFRLKGVTSISADIHKYGFGCKGASVLLYRDDTYRQYQFFAYSQWPGGLFGSPSMAGTRPGGNIAAAWVALRAMGVDGYMKMAKQIMDTTIRMRTELGSIKGLRVIGQPHMTAFALTSDDPDNVDIMAVADVVEQDGGWTLERQQCPSSLHFSVMPHHAKAVDQLVTDFGRAVEKVKANKVLAKQGSAAMYGMIGRIPDKTAIDDFIIQFFSEMYKL